MKPSPSVTIERRTHSVQIASDGRISGIYFPREKTTRTLDSLRQGRIGPRLAAELLRCYGVPLERAIALITTEQKRLAGRAEMARHQLTKGNP